MGLGDLWDLSITRKNNMQLLSVQRILVSLGMIVFVGAVAAGATGAFFSDTETSTGNTFAAGAIDLTVDSEQHYNGNVCAFDEEDGQYEWSGQSAFPVPGTECDGTWEATDLGAQKFWNFTDVKPGDEGENTISLHVDSNDAYACVDVTITENDDVDCTEPENDAEGVGICNTDGSPEFDGELADNLEFFAWADYGATPGFGDDEVGEGDNVWQAGEPPLFTNVIGPASDALDGESYTLADSNTGPLEGGVTNYIGMAWCAGDLSTSGPGVLDCDGSTMGNDAQTDNLVANVAFRVEQARNNSDFTCELIQ